MVEELRACEVELVDAGGALQEEAGRLAMLESEKVDGSTSTAGEEAQAARERDQELARLKELLAASETSLAEHAAEHDRDVSVNDNALRDSGVALQEMGARVKSLESARALTPTAAPPIIDETDQLRATVVSLEEQLAAAHAEHAGLTEILETVRAEFGEEQAGLVLQVYLAHK